MTTIRIDNTMPRGLYGIGQNGAVDNGKAARGFVVGDLERSCQHLAVKRRLSLPAITFEPLTFNSSDSFEHRLPIEPWTTDMTAVMWYTTDYDDYFRIRCRLDTNYSGVGGDTGTQVDVGHTESEYYRDASRVQLPTVSVVSSAQDSPDYVDVTMTAVFVNPTSASRLHVVSITYIMLELAEVTI